MRNYFCGWYFKCQSDKQTLAVIPALHRYGGKSSCSIQLITDEGAWSVDFPYESFRKDKKGLCVDINGNRFGNDGIRLCLDTPDCSTFGSLIFGPLSPIGYDIMGPFKYVPFMECRHSVFSMKHSVNGELTVKNKRYVFHKGIGYIEGDRGYSFPKEYVWTQCSFESGSLMLSVADIPMGPFHFTGVIGVILFEGKEYRLATYLGAKAVRIKNGEIVIRQGDTELTVRLIEKRAHPLFAPVGGEMSRIIRESASCRGYYRFKLGSRKVFEFESDTASFEYEYPV